MYGSSIMLVYSTGHGVHGFTRSDDRRDPLSHEDYHAPPVGYYSVNESNFGRW